MARNRTTKEKADKPPFLGVFVTKEMAERLESLAKSEQRKKAQMHRILLQEAMDKRSQREGIHPGQTG